SLGAPVHCVSSPPPPPARRGGILRCPPAAPPTPPGGPGCWPGRNRRCRLDTELVLDRLHCLDHVEHAPALERLDEILRCDLRCCHSYSASNFPYAAAGPPSSLSLYASSSPTSCCTGAWMVATNC